MLQAGIEDEGFKLINQKETQLFSSQKKETTEKINLKAILFAIILSLLALYWFKNYHQLAQNNEQPQQIEPPINKNTQFPRVLWIYSDNQFDSLDMVSNTMANYYIAEGLKNNYTVRLINHTSTYDWLSDEITRKITKARQIVKLDLEMEDLLILAVLVENGGVIIRHFDTLLRDALGWIEEGFKGGHQGQWTCDFQKASVLLFSEDKDFISFSHFSDSFIAARPNSPLLQQAIDMYIQISTSEPDSREIYSQVLEFDDRTRAYRAPNLVEYCLSAVVAKSQIKISQNKRKQVNQINSKSSDLIYKKRNECISFGLQTPRFADEVVDAQTVPVSQIKKYITSIQIDSCQRRVRALMQINKQLLTELISNTLRSQNNEFEKGSIMDAVITAEGNRQILLEPLPERTINFCIVFLTQIEEAEIDKITNQFNKQIYKNWTAVFPAKNSSLFDVEKIHNNVRLMESMNNKGHNIEQAITKHCPHTAHAVLLNKGEKFTSENALLDISERLRPRDVLGCLVNLEVQGEKLVPVLANARFDRKSDGIVNPKLDMMKNMTNHLRIFSVEVYKFLPQFDLRDPYGNFYEDRLIFIMSFYDMVRDSIEGDEKTYVIKKYAQKFNIPKRIVFAQTVSIATSQIDEVDKEQLRKTFTRLEVESISNILGGLIEWKISFDKMITFNKGHHYQNFKEKKGPLINQAIIHQAWLGGSLPPVKKYIFDKTAKIFPSFEMKLWTVANITEENFPVSYQYMKTLCEFNRNSPFNKFAVIADILRHEALYLHGGFWKDSSMNFLKPFLDDFRKYKLVIPVDKTLRYRYLQGMCFYGHIKHYEPALRIVNIKNLNRMRMYQSWPFDIAGPIDFRKLIVKDEQYDPDSLILAFETFYPGQLGQHPAGDLCTEQAFQPFGNKYEFIDKIWGVLANCSDIYPQAFGIEHNRFGVTWMIPETLRKPRDCGII